MVDAPDLSVALDSVVRNGVDPVPAEDRIDLGEILVADRPADRAGIVFDFVDRAAAHEGSADCRVGDGPAERELRQAPLVASRDALELVDRADVAREGL